MHAAAVVGANDGRPMASRPRFSGETPSTSLPGGIAFATAAASRCPGSGNSTKMAWNRASWPSCRTRSSTSFCDAWAGSIVSSRVHPRLAAAIDFELRILARSRVIPHQYNCY